MYNHVNFRDSNRQSGAWSWCFLLLCTSYEVVVRIQTVNRLNLESDKPEYESEHCGQQLAIITTRFCIPILSPQCHFCVSILPGRQHLRPR
jgi:hypothetical protein